MDEYKKKTNTGDDVFVRIQPQQTENNSNSSISPAPTAVVLGWFASKPKHVSKYTALYERMGYNTVQTTAPFSVVFPFTQRPTAIYLLSILRILASDDRLTAGGVIFQLFSNGGAVSAPFLSTMFHINQDSSTSSSLITEDNNDSSNNSSTISTSNSTITNAVTTVPPDFFNFVKSDDLIVINKVKQAHAAIIFDSAPVYLRVDLGHRAINEGLGIHGTILAYVVAFCFMLLCLLQRVLIYNLPYHFWNGLRHASYVCPELYIYSRMDHLLDIPRLESLIEERKQEGRQIKLFVVNDAQHVSILRKYPEKYIETVQSVNDWGINEWRRRNVIPLWSLPLQTKHDQDK